MSHVVKRSASHTVNAGPSRRSRPNSPLPLLVSPQLSQPVEKPPPGPQWVHGIKLDGFRMAARIDNGCVQLLTRTGLDWTAKYPSAVAALANVNVTTAYLDGELCGVDDAGLPSFAQTQAVTDGEHGARLLYYAFDLLHLDGRDVSRLPLFERKALLEPLVANKLGLQFNSHDRGDGELILKHAGKLGFEGVVSKTIDAPYAPGNRGLWRKTKALNRQEFVVVGWSHPEGTRPHLGALLLGYYTDDGKLIYAGRVGTGMPVKVLADLRRRLDPLARKRSPLSIPPPRGTRFGSRFVLSQGLVPRRHQSGEVDYVGGTSKCGDRRVRTLLYEAANVMLTRYKGQLKLKDWAFAIAKRSTMRKARIALARRLAVIMHAMLRNETDFAPA